MRQVCGLDVHKDSVFVCIINENGVVFQEKYGVLTPELEQMLAKMMEYHVEVYQTQKVDTKIFIS